MEDKVSSPRKILIVLRISSIGCLVVGGLLISRQVFENKKYEPPPWFVFGICCSGLLDIITGIFGSTLGYNMSKSWTKSLINGTMTMSIISVIVSTTMAILLGIVANAEQEEDALKCFHSNFTYSCKLLKAWVIMEINGIILSSLISITLLIITFSSHQKFSKLQNWVTSAFTSQQLYTPMDNEELIYSDSEQPIQFLTNWTDNLANK